MTELMTLSWPAARLGEALEGLARMAGLDPRAVEPLLPLIPHPLPEGEGTKDLPQKAPWGKGQDLIGALGHDNEALRHWLQAAASYLGIEAEPVGLFYGEVERLLPQLGPALLRLPGNGEPYFLAVLGGGRRSVTLL